MAKRRTLVLFNPPVAPTGDEDSSVPTGGGGGAASSRGNGTARGGHGAGGGGGGGGAGGSMEPLGTVASLITTFKKFNVWPDGSGPMGFGDALGSATLYGPGFIVELPYASSGESSPDRAEITQALVHCNDDDYAWPVLSRICKSNKWKMMDPDSGRTFG